MTGRLKKGITTGTCAAIASKAAARMIFEKREIKTEEIVIPAGISVKMEIMYPEFSCGAARCAVKKYAGDDPDVTDGILIFSQVKLSDKKKIVVDGGKGVGRVTKKGLSRDVGEAAINNVPKKMIIDGVREILDKYKFYGGAEIVISVPDGEEIAKKTFNHRLGIEGGISILGTSGIVEPMSEAAIIETIRLEINVKRAQGNEFIMITPGNYGLDFIKNTLGADLNEAVKCGNFIGEALDFSKAAGFKRILIIGHIGKLIKLAGGIMNTHSRNADSRMEIFTANAVMVCDDINVLRNIMNCISTDEAVQILKDTGYCEKVMERISNKALFYINNRIKEDIETGIIIFSNTHGILAEKGSTGFAL